MLLLLRLTSLCITKYHPIPAQFLGVRNMEANSETLEKMSIIIKDEIPKYLSRDFVIWDVKAENRSGPDDEDFVHIRVILEDDHPRLDPRKVMEFSSDMHTLFEQIGIGHPPNITYANRSELSL